MEGIVKHFIIKSITFNEYVCDIDEKMGVCWGSHDERLIFVNNEQTIKFLSKFGLYDKRFFKLIEVDEDGYDV